MKLFSDLFKGPGNSLGKSVIMRYGSPCEKSLMLPGRGSGSWSHSATLARLQSRGAFGFCAVIAGKKLNHPPISSPEAKGKSPADVSASSGSMAAKERASIRFGAECTDDAEPRIAQPIPTMVGAELASARNGMHSAPSGIGRWRMAIPTISRLIASTMTATMNRGIAVGRHIVCRQRTAATLPVSNGVGAPQRSSKSRVKLASIIGRFDLGSHQGGPSKMRWG